MPVTPFHFGPALLVKSVAPRHFSLVAFGVTQVIIDLETAYNMATGRWPLHRDLHTFLLGTTVSTLVGIGVGFAGAWLLRNRRWPVLDRLPGELTRTGCLVGGIFGGASHAFLDGIMHGDTRPFAPFSSGNPLHGILDRAILHVLCVVTGLLGLLVLSLRSAAGAKEDRPPSPGD